MWEQADKTGDKVTYSWLLDAPYRFRKELVGWRWVRGYPGCYVTNDPALAQLTAKQMDITIKSNGTHETHKVQLYQN